MYRGFHSDGQVCGESKCGLQHLTAVPKPWVESPSWQESVEAKLNDLQKWRLEHQAEHLRVKVEQAERAHADSTEPQGGTDSMATEEDKRRLAEHIKQSFGALVTASPMAFADLYYQLKAEGF